MKLAGALLLLLLFGSGPAERTPGTTDRSPGARPLSEASTPVPIEAAGAAGARTLSAPFVAINASSIGALPTSSRIHRSDTNLRGITQTAGRPDAGDTDRPRPGRGPEDTRPGPRRLATVLGTWTTTQPPPGSA